MNVDLESLIPARRPSGRLSKPSMELLVDNQRLLSQYIEPKKKRKIEIKKSVEDINSSSNFSEKSSVSSVEKPKFKKRKSALLDRPLDKVSKSVEKEIIKPDEVKKYKKRDKKLNVKDEKTQLDIPNGDDHRLDNGIKNEVDESNLLNRTAYVSIEINDLMIKTVKSPEKTADIIDDKSEDDLPLSKIYPDFKPRINEPSETRDTSTLPPKKKIKFVNFNELNGSSSKPQSKSPSKVVPKLKLIFSPTKTSVMSMPKIPKKSTKVSNGTISGELDIVETSPIKIPENLPVSEINTMPTSVSPSPPIVHHQIYIDTTKRCIRPSCTNIAIEDFRWDMEFCSPDCAIMYSKFLFNEWLNQRKDVIVSE